jgi:hypothetical protein
MQTHCVAHPLDEIASLLVVLDHLFAGVLPIPPHIGCLFFHEGAPTGVVAQVVVRRTGTMSSAV